MSRGGEGPGANVLSPPQDVNVEAEKLYSSSLADSWRVQHGGGGEGAQGCGAIVPPFPQAE